MAKPELLKAFDTLSRKIDSLLEENRNLKEKLKVLQESNLKLLSQHQEDEKNLNEAQKKIEFLSLSHRLADSPEALIEARTKVSSLIRTIDNCIRMLNEEV